MRVSIHQPQYIPWLGYFFRLLNSDIFVLFDTVQYPRGKHFANRNLVKTANGAIWLTVPVMKRGELLPYRDIPIDFRQGWAVKHWNTLELNYGRSEAFSEFGPSLRSIYIDHSWERLAELDESLIKHFLDYLSISTTIIRASELNVQRETLGTSDYILEILCHLKADSYITGQGTGSKRYIEPDAFAKRGIELLSYGLNLPSYSQRWGGFIPNLSIVDALFNCGVDTRELISMSGMLEAL